MFDHIYARDKWKCRLCKSRQSLTPHHIIYKSQQGPDDSWNVTTLCMRCHDAVHQGRLRVLAQSGRSEDRADANVGLKFLFLKGWTPNA